MSVSPVFEKKRLNSGDDDDVDFDDIAFNVRLPTLAASASLKNMLRAWELHVASAKVNTGHTWRQLMKSLQQSVR